MQAFAAVGASVGVRVRVEAGTATGASAWLDDVVLAGSGLTCQLQLPDAAAVHVELRKHEGRYWVRAFAPCTRDNVALSGEFAQIQCGERLLLGSVTLLLEEAPR
jgi:hypothetical protein